MFDIRRRDVQDVTILDVSGKITIGEGTMKFREAVRKLIDQGGRKLLLNFAEVTYIDSSGMGELICAYTTLNNQGGTLKLLNLPKRLKDLLKITKLLNIFEVFDDEAAAIKSFE